MTVSVAAITATGAWYGAGLKMKQDAKKVSFLRLARGLWEYREGRKAPRGCAMRWRGGQLSTGGFSDGTGEGTNRGSGVGLEYGRDCANVLEMLGWNEARNMSL